MQECEDLLPCVGVNILLRIKKIFINRKPKVNYCFLLNQNDSQTNSSVFQFKKLLFSVKKKFNLSLSKIHKNKCEDLFFLFNFHVIILSKRRANI